MRGLDIEDTIRVGKLIQGIKQAEVNSGLTVLVEGLQIWDDGEHIATMKYDYMNKSLRIQAEL